MAEAEITERLDRLIAILELVHRDEIRSAREEIRADATNALILDLAAEGISAKEMTEAVQKRTSQSLKTVQRRIADLVAARALERTGASASTRYKTTGLV